MRSKKRLEKNNFYLAIISALNDSTHLKDIQKKLKISKQNLTYYLRQMKVRGLIIQKGRGWYEPVKRSKNSTKYGFLLSKDSIRGHAYIWNIKVPLEIKDWDKRIIKLKEKGIHFELVGVLKTTPRIKVLGRKVWLCNDHIRIFDKPNNSYYGKNAIESKKYALQELLLIVGALESKLGLLFKPLHFDFKKQHYALIKNDLAINQNRKGIIWRIKDETGEWLLIDDSLEEGGELENVGNKSFETNIPMQKWWNDKKDNGFRITDTFILNSLGGLIKTQQMNADNIIKHQKVLDEMLITLKDIRDNLK